MKALFYRSTPQHRQASWITSLVCAIALAPLGSLLAQEVEEDIELITPKSEWRYNDSGEDLGTAWRESDYDDSLWKTGQAPLGYGDSNVANTTIEKGDNNNKIITQYFRKEFIAESPGQFTSLILRVQRDDGIIVYINGDRVLVDNIDQDAAYDTTATASIDGSNEKAWVETARTPAVLSQVGPFRNVIAVEVHQSSPTSSDTRFDCELLISKVIPAYGEVRVGIQTQFTESGDGAEFFTRNPLADPPEIEMNWTVKSSGAQFALTIDGGILPEEEPFFDEDENGVQDIQFFVWDQTLRPWESEKIDTRNYDNVQVRVDVRSFTEGNRGYASGSYFRGKLLTSSNGENFDTGNWFEIKGGGAKSIEWTAVVDADTVKTAIIPTSAEDPGPDWMNPEFNDSDWLSGVMGFGFDSPGGSFEEYWGTNVAEVMKGNNSACFIRIPFTVTDLGIYTDLQLRMRYDDGYVAFINGTQVASANAPDEVTWDASATASHSDSQAVVFEDVDLGSNLGILNDGENFLTIVGMNKGSGGSDFLIDTELRLGKPGDGPPASLEAVDSGLDYNKFSTLTSEIGQIADAAASLKIRLEAKTDRDEVLYFDNVRTLGDPIAADSFFAYMQLETGWELDDPRIGPHSDPDGDGMPNLLEYAFGASPQVSSQTTMVKGEEVSYLPEWNINRFAFASVSYRQISAPLALDGNDATTEGFHVQDIRYVAQISRGDLDDNGEMIWTDGTAGGEPVFEQRVPFQENEDGTVQINLSGLRPLSDERETYVRLQVRIVGFEVPEN